MEKNHPAMGRMFLALRNQEEKEFIFSQIWEVRILTILPLNLKLWKKIHEPSLTKKICEIMFENAFMEICYYPGFYSSLTDHMGLNGGLFPKRSEIMILMVNLIKFHLINFNSIDFINNIMKLCFVWKLSPFEHISSSGSCKSLDNSKCTHNWHEHMVKQSFRVFLCQIFFTDFLNYLKVQFTL